MLATISIILLACSHAGPIELSIEAVGRFDFPAPSATDHLCSTDGLSGITRVNGDHYLAIGDRSACIHSLIIQVHNETGRVESAVLHSQTRLHDRSNKPFDDPNDQLDREGIVFDATSNTVVIANEQSSAGSRGPSLERYALATGVIIGQITPSSHRSLEVFGATRTNFGFESVAMAEDGAVLWTANEEALTVDGAPSTTSRGTVVRLVKLDRDLAPLAHYAYQTDPIPGGPELPVWIKHLARSGVCDLLVLPEGELLVLERAFGLSKTGTPTIRIRIYKADTTTATDVSLGELAHGLAGKSYRLVSKTLLIDLDLGPMNSNYEGITCGPVLANGDRALLLIADNQGLASQSIYALRLSRTTRRE